MRPTRTLGFTLASLLLLSGLGLAPVAETAEAYALTTPSVSNLVLPSIPSESASPDTRAAIEGLPREFLEAWEVASLDASVASALNRYARNQNLPVRDLPLREVPASGALVPALRAFVDALAPFTQPAHLRQAEVAAEALPDDLQAALARVLYAMVDAGELQRDALKDLSALEFEAVRGGRLDDASLAAIAAKVDLSKTLDGARLLDKAVRDAEAVFKKWGLLTDIHRKTQGPGVSDAAVLAAASALVTAESPVDVFRWTAAMRGVDVPRIPAESFEALASIPPSQLLAGLYHTLNVPVTGTDYQNFLAADDLHPNLARALSVLVGSASMAQFLVLTQDDADPEVLARLESLAPEVARIALSTSAPTAADLETLRGFNRLLDDSRDNGNTLLAAAILLEAAEWVRTEVGRMPSDAEHRPHYAAGHNTEIGGIRAGGVYVEVKEHPNNHTTQVTVEVTGHGIPDVEIRETHYFKEKVVYEHDDRCTLRVWVDENEDGAINGNEEVVYDEPPTCDRGNGVIYHDTNYFVMLLDDGSSVIDSRYADRYDERGSSVPSIDVVSMLVYEHVPLPFTCRLTPENYNPNPENPGSIFNFGSICSPFAPEDPYADPGVRFNRDGYQFVLLDLGGDDVYRNNAGGTYNQSADSDAWRGAFVAVHVDLAGNDVYETSRTYTMGAADGGVGLLLDYGGDDRFTGGDRVLGVGNFTRLHDNLAGVRPQESMPAPFCPNLRYISDGRGRDNSRLFNGNQASPLFPGADGRSACQSFHGYGLFFSMGGNDTFTAGQESMGYGNNSFDRVAAGFSDPQHESAGERATARYYGMPSLGLFYAHEGNDVYGGTHLTQGVGNNSGLGVFIDRAGDDRYSFTGLGNFSQGKGVENGVGILLDLGGSNGGLERTGGVGVQSVAGVDFDTRAYHKWKVDSPDGTSSRRQPVAHGYGILVEVNLASDPSAAFRSDDGAFTAPGATVEMQEDPFFHFKIYMVLPGAIALGTVDSNTWRSNYTFLLDFGGDDRYTNRPGAASLDWTTFTGAERTYALDVMAAPVVNVSGALPTPSSNRTGLVTPVALSINLDGNDHYRLVGENGEHARALGYGLAALGFHYTFTNGNGNRDVYETSGMSHGAGEVFGMGVFYDESGDDRYDVRLHRSPAPATGRDGSRALGYAERGGAGIFLDVRGNDVYRGFNLTAGTVTTNFNFEFAQFFDGQGSDRYELGDKSQGFVESPPRKHFPSGFEAIFGSGRGECYHGQVRQILQQPNCNVNPFHETVETTLNNRDQEGGAGINAILALFVDDGNIEDHYAPNLVRKTPSHGNNRFWQYEGKGPLPKPGQCDEQGICPAVEPNQGESYGIGRGYDNSDYYASTQVYSFFTHENRNTLVGFSDGGVGNNFTATFFPEFFLLRATLLSPTLFLSNERVQPNDRRVNTGDFGRSLNVAETQGAPVRELEFESYYGTSSIYQNSLSLVSYLGDETSYRFTCGVIERNPNARSLAMGSRPSHEPHPDALCEVLNAITPLIDTAEATAQSALATVAALLAETQATVAQAQEDALENVPDTGDGDSTTTSNAVAPATASALRELARNAEAASEAFAHAPYVSLVPVFSSLARDAHRVAEGDGGIEDVARHTDALRDLGHEITARSIALHNNPAPVALLLLAAVLEHEALRDPELRLALLRANAIPRILDTAAASFSAEGRSAALAELADVFSELLNSGGSAGHHEAPPSNDAGSKVQRIEIWVARENRAWWDQSCDERECLRFAPVARCDNSNPHNPACEWRDPEGAFNDSTWQPAELGCLTSAGRNATFCKEGDTTYRYRLDLDAILANGSQRWPNAQGAHLYSFLSYAWGQMNDLESEWNVLARATGNTQWLAELNETRTSQAWRFDDNYGYWPGLSRTRVSVDAIPRGNSNETVLTLRHFNPDRPSDTMGALVQVSEPVQFVVEYRYRDEDWVRAFGGGSLASMNWGATQSRNNLLSLGDWLAFDLRPANAREGRYDVRLTFLDAGHTQRDFWARERGNFTLDVWADSRAPISRFLDRPENDGWINRGLIKDYDGLNQSAILPLRFSEEDYDPFTQEHGGAPIVAWQLTVIETRSDCVSAARTSKVTLTEPSYEVKVVHGRCYEFILRAVDGAGNVQEADEIWQARADLSPPTLQAANVLERMHPERPVTIPYVVDAGESVFLNDVRRVEVWYNITDALPVGPYARVDEYVIEPLHTGAATFDVARLRHGFNLANVSEDRIDAYTAYVLVVPVDEAGNRGGFNYALGEFTGQGQRVFRLDTLAPEIVTGRPGIDPQYHQANLRWTFTEIVDPDTVSIEWGFAQDFEEGLCVAARCPPPVKPQSHDNVEFTATIPGLSQETPYRFVVHAADLVGNAKTHGPFDFDSEPVAELAILSPGPLETVRGTVEAKLEASNVRVAPGDPRTAVEVTYNLTIYVDGDRSNPYHLGDVRFTEQRDIRNPARTFLFDSRLIPDTRHAELVVRITTPLNPSNPIERVSAVFRINNDPPTIVPVFEPDRVGDWFNQRVVLRFDATDKVSENVTVFVSETNRTGSFSKLEEPLVFDAEGIHTRYYYGQDGSGNTNRALPVVFAIDRTAPNARVRINDAAPATSSREVVLQIEALDALSGVHAIVVRTADDSTTLTGDRVRDGFVALPWVLPPGDGVKHVEVVVTDLAGNSATVRASIVLDMTPPRIAAGGFVWNPITFTGATLSFETNEPASTTVLTKRTGDPAFGSPVERLVTASTHRVVIENLAPSTAYEVKVIVHDELRNEAVYYSNITTRSDVTPPTEPGSVRAADTGFGYLDVSWESAHDNVGVFRYLVQRSADGGRTWETAGIALVTTFLDDDVVPGQTYSYRVQAEDRAGNAGPWSVPTSGRATTPPVLLAADVSPRSGTLRETFTYSVVYRDLDGDAPVYVRVIINGQAFDMARATTGDPDFREGVRYVYRTQLAESRLSGGMNVYHFEASDGRNAARAPSFLDGTGPAVLSAGPGSLHAASTDDSGIFGTVRAMPAPSAGLMVFAFLAVAIILQRRWNA